MTRVKMCGMRRMIDIEYANEVMPDYIGFIFDSTRRRYVSPEAARELRDRLDRRIVPVGVFVDESPKTVAKISECGIIDMIQLHGCEEEKYIAELRELTDKPIIKAFTVKCADDVKRAAESSADYILLDSGQGSGKTFDRSLIGDIGRDYFLAGGISPENAAEAVSELRPFALDASSSLETDGFKDINKMKAFMEALRKDRM